MRKGMYSATDPFRLRWRLGIFAALAVTRALHPQLTFVVTSTKVPADLSRVDLWYERGQGEQVGEFMLYRVKPTTKN